jgi:hypothetical protein
MKPSTVHVRSDKDRLGMGSGDDRGDWRLRALHHERGHCVVTGSVASGTGPVTGACS